MKRTASLIAGALALALASGALAGDEKKCTMDPAECKAKMKAKIAKKAWLGVELDKNDDKRVVVTEVVPDSPAAVAGFQKGDVLVSLDGIDYYTEDEAAKKKLKKAWAQGHKGSFTVVRAGAEQTLEVEFGKVPEKVAKKWMVEHMKKHHPEVAMAKKEKAKKGTE